MESPATEREGAGDSIKRIKAADSKQLPLTKHELNCFCFINEQVLKLIENNFSRFSFSQMESVNNFGTSTSNGNVPNISTTR
jgi:hypothetical protein